MIQLHYENCLKNFVGPSGLHPRDFPKLRSRSRAALEAVEALRRSGKIGFPDLPDRVEEARRIQTLARSWRGKYENFVVIGIGGSALGNIALQTALRHPQWNLLPGRARGGSLRLFVPDNVDPTMLAGLMEVLDPGKTLYNVVSKSGTTAECLANYFILRKALERKVGTRRAARHLLFTTDPQKGFLRETARREGILTFDVPPNVGGRFSVLSPVGLVSAAATGVDLEGLLAGARAMRKRCEEPALEKNPAALYAAIHVLFQRRGRPIHVMMPYSNELRDVADWFRQLWAESLGKKLDRKGRRAFTGPTPVKALGATDQHSQVQLYIEGPHDKVITFLSVGAFGRDCAIPAPAGHYLAGQRLSRLFKSEERATRAALAREGRPNLTLSLPSVTPASIGELIYLLELATALAGELLDINAFDQPGVELGKVLTYALMGREGFSEHLRSYRKWLKAPRSA